MVEVRLILFLYEVCMRGEYLNLNVIYSEVDVGMLYVIRNIGVVLFLVMNLLNKELFSKIGMKLNNFVGVFWDGLFCWDGENEWFERKLYLIGLSSRGRVENENGDVVDNIENNVSVNFIIKIKDEESNIGDNIVKNIVDNIDNVCRILFLKKYKLSLKCIFFKDKGMLVMKK